MGRKLDLFRIAAVAFSLAVLASRASADAGKTPPGNQETDPGAAGKQPPPPPAVQDSPSLAALQAQIDQANAEAADYQKRLAALQKMYDGSGSTSTVAGSSSTVTGTATSTNVVSGQLAAKGPKIPIAQDAKSKDGDSGGGSKPGVWDSIKGSIGPMGGMAGMVTMLLGVATFTPWMFFTGLGVLVGMVILGAVLDTYT